MDRHKCCLNLSVQPSRGMVDQKFTVLVHNCPPGFQLTLHARHQSDDGHAFQAFAHYCASASGSVDASEDPSLGGTYSGTQPMGLLWSLRQVPGSKPGLRLRKTNVLTPMEVTISVYPGHQSQGFDDLVPLASVVVERWYVAPGVLRVPVTEGGLTGTLFLPPGPGPFPGVVDLWGGGGRLVEYRAALLASHGFASLALDYITPKVTIETGKMVDFDYLEPRCVVCISGSHVQPVDASMEQIFAYFDQHKHKTRRDQNQHLIWRDLLLPIPTDPSLKVDVGQLQVPLLLVVGEDDQNWPAQESAQDMKEMMERAGNSHLLTVLSYPGTGHLIEPPYTPHFRFSAFKTVLTEQLTMALWGGETAAHARAQDHSWRKMLGFLRHNLYAAAPP
ncbi:unnamed protein product [Tetraodon nigroviridis]|uniref:(spotted green pufferfish) hypothetical protein n=1 Tax=Tetraodon nigroviridis TaxID=99883 RepID=Q4SE67_TETNG|nr:unnamed protein product [Tetraodon nigroviridis]